MDIDKPPMIAEERSAMHKNIDKKLEEWFLKGPTTPRPKDEHFLNEGRLLTIRLPGQWEMRGPKWRTVVEGGNPTWSSTTFVSTKGGWFTHHNKGGSRPEVDKLLKSQPHKLTEAEIESISNEVDGAVDQAVVEYINNEKVLRVDSHATNKPVYEGQQWANDALCIKLFVHVGQEGAEELFFQCPKELISVCKPDFETAIKSIEWKIHP